MASSAGCCLHEGRITFPTEAVYLDYMWRLHYKIPGAEETLRSFESHDTFRKLKSGCYQAYRIPLGIQPKNQLQWQCSTDTTSCSAPFYCGEEFDVTVPLGAFLAQCLVV